MRTRPVNLRRDPSLPTGIHDPRWREPETGARVAFNTFQRLLMNPALFPEQPLVPSEALGGGVAGSVDRRSFVLLPAQEIEARGLRFRGGSYGELHRRYSFGGRLPAVNFHAQAVCFGADSEGRYFLQATVGRMDGGWGNRAALVAAFTRGDGILGGVQWVGEMDPPADHTVLVTGRTTALGAGLETLTEVRVAFHTHHAGR